MLLPIVLAASAACGDAEKKSASSASASESSEASATASNIDLPLPVTTAAVSPDVWAAGSVCTTTDVAILGSVGSAAASSPGSSVVKPGAVSVSGRLPPEVIQRIVRGSRSTMRSCYEAGLASNPSLAGKVTVSFVIGRDGSVGSVSGGGDLPDASVISCITKVFYGMTFPKPEGGVVKVTYPIAFSSAP